MNNTLLASFLCSLIILITSTSHISGVTGDQDEDIPHNEVRNWALKIGVDLWEFGRQQTKMNDIKNRYKDSDIEVVRKDGIILLRNIAAEVRNFLEFKINAVMRIMDSAEQAALSESDRDAQQSSQSSSGFFDARRLASEYSSEAIKSSGTKYMRRFEKLPVNLSGSSVFSVAGVDMNEAEIKNAAQWSAHLDPIFANNLERDPSISWQYFGSSAGFLRRYPGLQGDDKSNINDFRMENWFIQAASSPKDIIILLDASSSISKKSFQLAVTTVSAILDTLGDDDFVNVVAYSDKPQPVVQCFKDKLVRATPDNIKEIKSSARSVKTDNVANLTAGFEYGFEILHRYNQSKQGSQCNQAIMLVTDKLTESYQDLIKHYNHPHMPVRIFTYLIGKDSSSQDLMHQMACQNKGFFTKIETAEDAKLRVLEYALVMARPMVLYQADHPTHWSPVFLGGRSSGLGPDNENKRRLVTTVTTPVFDRRQQSVRVANMLGVVGTDVPIEEIQKMIPQHKLGVNAYSFIIDNNGRVLYHPDLRPHSDNSQYSSTLKPKYNSVDLTEVELPEMDANMNENQKDENTNYLLDMRHEMVDQKEGEMEFSVLNHDDKMKRVSVRSLKYFYGPIDGTPFTLALALPEKYGMHELNAQQEIRHSHLNVTEYFKNSNWKVHPDWVYCEYNNLHDLEKERDNSGESFSRDSDIFETPEEQLLHFLSRAGRPGWKWMSVRPRSPQPHHGHGAIPVGQYAQHLNQNGATNGAGGSKKAESYYCDRDLVQSLVRDAIVTDALDRVASHPTRKEDKQQGIQMFNVVVSFVATRSGLLRWINHKPLNEDVEHESAFGDENARAMDMTWFKRAVEQHTIEPESFVYSVPFNSGYSGKNNKTLVTASHAIFIDHRGHKAPAAVVGLQIQHETLARHFINITSACTGNGGGCRKTCASDELDCYLLDNNGFIILSENNEHTGRFFGNIDGTIMDSLVQDRIYRRVGLMDYQGLCSDRDRTIAAGERLKFEPFNWILKYLVSFGATWLSLLPVPIYGRGWSQLNDYDQPSYDDGFDNPTYDESYEGEIGYYPESDPEDVVTPEREREKVTPPPRVSPPPVGPRVVPDPSHARPCDLKTDLYVLQPDRLNSSGQSNPLKGKLTNCHSSGCERPFSVQKIPHSNLILLVVDTLCPCGSKQLDIEPLEITGSSGACGTRRLGREFLPRKRPSKCINYHPEETEIQQCGHAISISISSSIIVSLCIYSFIVLFKNA